MSESDGFRWWVLGATAMGMFAYGYAYDNPVALQRQLLTTYDLSNVQYNLLYSIYAFPNMILPAIAGVISDKIGYDWLVIFFFGLMVLAQGLFVFGCYSGGSFAILIVARLTFGIGAESHALVETPLIYDYFNGKELAFALALHLSMARAGSSVNDITTYLAYTHYSGSVNDKIVFATSIGLFILFVLWICIIIMVLVHRVRVRRKKLLAKMLRKRKRKKKRESDRDSSLSSATMQGVQHLYDDASDGGASQINININDNLNDIIAPLIDTSMVINTNKKQIDTNSHSSLGTVTSKMKLSDVTQFDIVFWLLVWNCAIMYAIVLSWMNIGSDFLQTSYNYSHGQANAILTIPYAIAGILQPIWGWISDKVGWRSQFLLVSSFIFVFAHYILGWIRFDHNPIYVPIVGLSLLGFGYSIFTAVIWPCFPLVVPPRAIGTAYGIPTSGYNLVLTIYYVLIGVFTSSQDNSNKYINVQFFLLITSISTVLSSLLLLYKDKKTGWRLYPSAFEDSASNADIQQQS